MSVRYCSKCVYPSIAVNLMLDDDGVCSACRAAEDFDDLTDDFWDARRDKFVELAAHARSLRRPYDCVIPVSGGKDSYYQVHVALEHGLKPLLVTYHGNNFLPEGERNLERMRHVFDVDHIIFRPSEATLVALNRLGFQIMGDMNWHAHAGIKIFPLQVAVRFDVPLMLWGETTWQISGMFSPEDYVQYNKRTVLEHDCRGFTWQDMVGADGGLEEQDLSFLKFPTDEQIDLVGTTGIYVGNFFRWEANEHIDLVVEKYGFEIASEPFQRTYRRMSNLDDMHENGAHDWLKFVKFGYGRASDHASKDVRAGLLSRAEAIDMVREYDAVKPTRDLARWYEYASLSAAEFDRVADTFRDLRVWAVEDGMWVKDTVWGTREAFGPVTGGSNGAV